MENEDKKISTIGKDYTFWGLVAFTLPSILQQICSQLFSTLDDALFVSRYVGSDALAAINLMNPVTFLRMGITSLLTMGASTIAARRMGEGKHEDAKSLFTKVVISAIGIGIVLSIILNVFSGPILNLLGADDSTRDYALTYIRIVYGGLVIHLLSVVLNSFYSTCGQPKMGLVNSIVNGASNIIFDFILVKYLRLGVVGSSISTVLGDFFCMVIGLVFYSSKKREIHFRKPIGKFAPDLIESSKASMPQFINSISMSICMLVTNKVILSMLGSDGIAANAISGDIRRILNAGIMGYSACVAPVIAYNCGSQNYTRLKKIINYNLTYWFFGSIILTALGEIFRDPLISVFFGENSSQVVHDYTYEALSIEFCSIIASTACMILNRTFVSMSETKVATVTSTLRNIVFRIVTIIVLPLMFGATGIWISFPASEFLSFFVSVYFFLKIIPKYNIHPRDLKFSIK